MLAAIVAAALVVASLICAGIAFSGARKQRIEDRDTLVSGAVRQSSLGKDGAARESSHKGSERLHAAGLEIGSVLWTALKIAASIVVFSVVSAFSGSTLAGFFCACGVFVGAILYVNARIRKRRELLGEQFGRACLQIAGSIKASSSIERAIQSAAAYVDDPLREEFMRVASETAYDVDVASALRRMAERTGNKDVAFFAACVDINQRRGGKLADSVSRLASTVAARVSMARFIKTESANGRSGAKAILGLTVLIIVAMFATTPDYIEFYTTNPLGWLIIAVSGGLIVVGAVWLRSIVNIELD